MTCTRCGSARLALALEPGERVPTRAVCLACGALQHPAEVGTEAAPAGPTAADAT